MAGIGAQLKAARERLGISAADAAKRLHMRAMFVDALEREDWKAAGEPVYVRGFVRNYARTLGLDPCPIVDAFNTTEYASSAASVEAVTAALESRRQFRYPWLLAGMSVLAAILVVKVVWTMATPSAAGHGELHPQQASAMTSSAAGAMQSSGAAEAAAAVSRQQNSSGVDLRLELTQPCWLSVSVDGKRVVYQTLPAGTVKEFHGVHQISLRAGNAGGVVATIDGQTLGKLGSPGQVQDRVFAVKLPPIGQSGPHE